ncbi:hypothetical protein B0H34DRAFT_504199 [Crassisporium funariophilum]|nr:hypothetical protein B0H34DRAFT_504199 [Crassisporium funariophilum]
MGEYENILGTLIIGVFINTFLFGIVCVQYILYYSRKLSDTFIVRTGVSLLFFNDAFQSLAMIYMAWFYSVSNAVDPHILNETLWPYAFIPIGTACTALITHVAMAHRIHCLSRRLWLFGSLILISMAAFGNGVAYGAGIWITPDIDLHGSFKILVASWLGIQASLDILIAGLLTFYLYHQRTGTQTTDTVINRLIRGAIQTGLLPTILAVAGLVAFIVRPETNLYVMFVIPIGRTYTTTLMDGMNVREELKERLLRAKEPTIILSNDVWRVQTRTHRQLDVGCLSTQDPESLLPTESNESSLEPSAPAVQDKKTVKPLMLEDLIFPLSSKQQNPWS